MKTLKRKAEPIEIDGKVYQIYEYSAEHLMNLLKLSTSGKETTNIDMIAFFADSSISCIRDESGQPMQKEQFQAMPASYLIEIGKIVKEINSDFLSILESHTGFQIGQNKGVKETPEQETKPNPTQVA